MKLHIFEDIRWAWGMLRVRRMRRHLLYSARCEVDEAFQHQSVIPPRGASGRCTIAYPDAFWLARPEDIRAALVVAEVAAWRGHVGAGDE
jgi:hypothetical protein